MSFVFLLFHPHRIMADLNEILADFEQDVSDFISTDVVDVESGKSMGGRSKDPEFDGSVASAAFSNVVKAYRTAFDELGMDPASLQDILGTADNVLILTRLIGDRSFYHGLAISKEGNLALARRTMKEYEDRIVEAVTETQSTNRGTSSSSRRR